MSKQSSFFPTESQGELNAVCGCGENGSASAFQEMRCGCGNLLARRVPNGVELKCRRCKRKVLLTFKEANHTAA